MDYSADINGIKVNAVYSYVTAKLLFQAVIKIASGIFLGSAAEKKRLSV